MNQHTRNLLVAIAAVALAAAAFIAACRSPAVSAVATPAPVQEPAAEQVGAPDATRSIRVDGREVVVGARDKVTFEHQDTVTDIGAASRTDRQAATTGVGLGTSADQVAQNFRAEQASVGLDDVGSAAGGGFSYSGKMSGGMQLNVFHAIGAACLLGALGFVVVPLFLKTPPRIGTAAALATGGVAFIAIGTSIESMPWAWALAGLLILAGLGFWLFMAVKSGRTLEHRKSAIEALVASVASLDAPTAAAVKAAMNSTMASWTPAERTQVETEVAATKSALGI